MAIAIKVVPAYRGGSEDSGCETTSTQPANHTAKALSPFAIIISHLKHIH